jgi:magnesium chelatase family protein
MLAKVKSGAVIGLDGAIVEVEVDISNGLPSFTIVGLPDAAVQEARERVRAAIRNSGCTFPMKRIVVNLAPADLKKAGPAYDLPIAICILLSSEQVTAEIADIMFLGELSLDGSLRHTNGILPMAALAHEEGITTVIVPDSDAGEAALIEGVKIIPMSLLSQLVSYLRGEIPAPQFEPPTVPKVNPSSANATDLADIKGQEHIKRALEIAAAGGHNMIMCGPPGSGKTLLARSLPSILPPMTNEEALEVTKIYSVSGILPSDTPLIRQRPFRAPTTPFPTPAWWAGGTGRNPAKSA